MHVSVLNFALVMLGLGMSYFFVRLSAAAPGWGPTMTVTGLLAVLLTLVQPRAGLYVLVYSMLLSPGFAAGQLADRAIEVRLDDVFLVLVFVAWFAIATLRREPIIGLRVPLLKPMAIYLAIAAVSTLFGILREEIGYRTSFFYWLKYAQYYMLYYMTYSMIERFDKSKPYLLAGLATAIAVVGWAYYLMAIGENPYCPFDIDRGVKETATLGGYLVIVAGIAGGVALYYPSTLVRASMLALIVACIPPVLSATSRATYLAGIGLLAAMFVLGRGRRVVLAVAAVVGLYILPTIFHAYVERAQARVAYTFVATGEEMTVNILGKDVTLEVSAATRLRKWDQMVRYWLPAHPFIGHGVTGVGLVDTQIPRVVGEVGLIGFAAWAAIMWGLLSRSYRLFEAVDDPLKKGLAFGFVCVYCGLLVQSIGVNTFIIIRLMEPFWFFAAIMMRLYSDTFPPAETSENARPREARPHYRRAYT